VACKYGGVECARWVVFYETLLHTSMVMVEACLSQKARTIAAASAVLTALERRNIRVNVSSDATEQNFRGWEQVKRLGGDEMIWEPGLTIIGIKLTRSCMLARHSWHWR